MDKEKKKWETPKLICLYRGRPEEAVLAYCKMETAGLNPIAGQNPCKKAECSGVVAT